MDYEGAITLLAAIAEQAKRDLRNGHNETCAVDYPHTSRRCARIFLAELTKRKQGYSRKISPLEVAEDIVEIIR